MKKDTKTVLKLIAFCFACCALLVGGGYYYLRANLKPTEIQVPSVPYSFSSPGNKGVMLDINGELTFLYFDFEKERLAIIIPPDGEYSDEIFGYSIDHRIKADYRLLGAVIDYADGIELNDGENTLRYTGVQVTEMLSRTVDTNALKREIIMALMKKIGENGIDEAVYKYIITNSETDIKMPEFYTLSRYIKALCKDGVMIN